MALLMMDDEDDTRKHFNYKKIVEQQNLSKKKKKLLMKKKELLEDDFQVIVYSLTLWLEQESHELWLLKQLMFYWAKKKLSCHGKSLLKINASFLPSGKCCWYKIPSHVYFSSV